MSFVRGLHTLALCAAARLVAGGATLPAGGGATTAFVWSNFPLALDVPSGGGSRNVYVHGGRDAEYVLGLAAAADTAVVLAIPGVSAADVTEAASHERLPGLTAQMLSSQSSAVVPSVQGVDATTLGDRAAFQQGWRSLSLSTLPPALAASVQTGAPGGVMVCTAEDGTKLDVIDKWLSSITATLAAGKGTFVVVVAMLGGVDDASVTPQVVRDARRLLVAAELGTSGVEAGRRQLAADSTSTTYIRMTPTLFSGVMVGLLFVFVTLLGLSCVSKIQTPSQFAMEGPPSSREY